GSQSLECQVAAGHELDTQLDEAVRTLTGPLIAGPRVLPKQLTARARRVLEQGRELLGHLRTVADCFEPEASSGPSSGAAALMNRDDPMNRLYRQSAALLDAALRVVPLLPESATAQLHLCEGLEAALQVVSDRLVTLQGGVERQRHESGQVARLAELLTTLAEGRPTDVQPFLEL